MNLSRRRIITHGITAFGVAALLSRVAEATVWNGEELRHALANLAPGSTIRLMPGTNYGTNGHLVLDQDGMTLLGEGEECVIRDECVVLASGLTISATAFRGPLRVDGPGTRVTGCDFCVNMGGTVDMLAIAATATGTEVAGCKFHDGTNCQAAVGVGAGQTTANRNVGANIHDNAITNFLQAGTETIRFKASGNTAANNILTNTHNITSRCGSNNVISGNTVSGGYGIVVQDDGNHVIGNKVISPQSGKGIFIMAGDAPYTSNVQGVHAQAANTEVTGNTGPLMIGKQYGPRYTFPALNTRVSGHSGPITRTHDQGTTVA